MGVATDDINTPSIMTEHEPAAASPSRITNIPGMMDEKGTKMIPIPWRKPAVGPSFNAEYPVEFRDSSIAGAGWGTWALVDIPAGVRIRRVAEADGTLHCFRSLEEFKASGWDVDDACNYGIRPYGHEDTDPSAICYLNPGTAMNHAAGNGRVASLEYRFIQPGVIEIWSIRDIVAGEEIFNDYGNDFGPCEWYDQFQNDRGNTPLTQLPAFIASMYETSTLEREFHTEQSTETAKVTA